MTQQGDHGDESTHTHTHTAKARQGEKKKRQRRRGVHRRDGELGARSKASEE